MSRLRAGAFFCSDGRFSDGRFSTPMRAALGAVNGEGARRRSSSGIRVGVAVTQIAKSDAGAVLATDNLRHETHLNPSPTRGGIGTFVHCRRSDTHTHTNRRELQPSTHSCNYISGNYPNEYAGADARGICTSIELPVCRRPNRAERWDNVGLRLWSGRESKRSRDAPTLTGKPRLDLMRECWWSRLLREVRIRHSARESRRCPRCVAASSASTAVVGHGLPVALAI